MKLIYLFLVLFICVSPWAAADESLLKTRDTSTLGKYLESATRGKIERKELMMNENSKNVRKFHDIKTHMNNIENNFISRLIQESLKFDSTSPE